MKLTIAFAFFISPFFTFSQAKSNAVYKNDIAITYGAELNHFYRKIPGLEYRRALNENWKLKLGLMADRKFKSLQTIYNTEFALSDSSIMRRGQFLSYGAGATMKIGADYTGFKHFSFGAQFIFGKGSGTSYVNDRAFYDIGMEEQHYVYSEELTEAYHPSEIQPGPGVIEIGQRSEGVSYTDYWVYGLGLTTEAKWPIGKHFEAALQYAPEILHYQLRSQYNFFELDSYYTDEFKGMLDFQHFTNLYLRYKF